MDIKIFIFEAHVTNQLLPVTKIKQQRSKLKIKCSNLQFAFLYTPALQFLRKSIY